jgi:hypothetical protein
MITIGDIHFIQNLWYFVTYMYTDMPIHGWKYYDLWAASSIVIKFWISKQTQTKTNSVALVCKQTLPTERPPLVSEISADFCG